MKTLGILGEILRNNNIKAEFRQWTAKIPDIYWVYTYIEADNSFETGCKSGTIILDGFTRNSLSLLENQKEKIIQLFEDFRKTIGNTVVYLGSAEAQQIDTYDKELKRVQINIDFKEWRILNYE